MLRHSLLRQFGTLNTSSCLSSPFHSHPLSLNRQKHCTPRTSLSQHLSLKDCSLESGSLSIGHLAFSDLE